MCLECERRLSSRKTWAPLSTYQNQGMRGFSALNTFSIHLGNPIFQVSLTLTRPLAYGVYGVLILTGINQT